MAKQLVLTVGLIGALAVALLAGQMEIVEQVLVKVNGDILTKSEFEQRTIQALAASPELINVPSDSPLFNQAVSEVTPGLILDAVDELLFLQRGRELGYALGDEQFQEIVSNIQVENDLEDEAQFQAELRAQGLTMSTLRRLLERQMLVQRVQQEDVFNRLVITEDEARAYYDANRADFTTPVTLTLRELLIDVPVSDQGINVSADNEAQAQAVEARARALGGEPFADLVSDLSDAPSAANGGLIGPLNFADLAAALQTEIDTLMVGGVTQVLRTQRGYQILRLESRTQPRVVTFEEARDEVGNRVAQAKSGVEMQRYLEQLRGQATIVWQNDELEGAYETALAGRRDDLGLAQAVPVAAGG